jgi:hypothetical protein
MRKMFVTTLAFCLYQSSAFATAPLASMEIPGECRNLALMQAQLLNTHFHSNQMGAETYNPSEITLKTSNGLLIGKIEYLGGDNEDETGPNVGKYACDLDQTLCTTPGDAGGAMDWARVTVTSNETPAFDVAQVVVSMGSRGGCIINSARHSK